MDELIAINQIEILEAAEEMEANPGRDFWSKWMKDQNPFQNLSEEQFIKLFRLSKNTTEELIEELDEFLPNPTRRSCIPKAIKV